MTLRPKAWSSETGNPPHGVHQPRHHDGAKRSVVFPVKHKVQVPLIGKKQAQVLSVTGTEVQMMDLETYETFSLPLEAEMKDQLTPGAEVQYLDAMGKRRVTRA